jgi:hypothetical protein
MTRRIVATVTALTSLVFGAGGLVAPQTMAIGFGARLDPMGMALVRLACASYVGYGVLAWLARDLTDPGAWRAVAVANIVSWALSAAVLGVAILSGLGDARAWALVALQVAFTVAWSLAYLRAPSAAERAT